MIFDISDTAFKKILNDNRLFLPIRWDGSDFVSTLDNLFNYYIEQIEVYADGHGDIHADINEIKHVCRLLKKAVTNYLNGFPAKAYRTLGNAMEVLMKRPLRIYQKSVMEQFELPSDCNRNEDKLKLFRVVRVEDNRTYPRARVFHTPYNLRSKVSTSRYSIAGYPSLYLGTALNLCCEELNVNPNQNLALASMFQLERELRRNNINIRVIELGVKPQDFLQRRRDGEVKKRELPPHLLEDVSIRAAYLLWYPLIAACSYIRVNKNDPFAAEYIIPQLLMQWVRNETAGNRRGEYGEIYKMNVREQLIGIRYFSCASVKASDMGFNYVFPTSGKQESVELPYCPVLTRAFRLTKPVYIHEYDSIQTCEDYLRDMWELKPIR